MTTPEAAHRYVTGHDDNGKAIFQFEGEIEYTSLKEKSGKEALFGVAWKNDGFPADNQVSVDQAVLGGPVHNEHGTLVRVVEFPLIQVPLHTERYRWIMASWYPIHLELEDGNERRLVSGDIVVQRGTVHTWHNKTDEYARMIYVLVAAKPVVIEGKALDYHWE